MHNFTLASPPIPNIKFLSFVVSEKCVILKICTFSIKNHDFTRKNQQINLNFELSLNNSVIMLPTKNCVDRPKIKSAIALTKFRCQTYNSPIRAQNIYKSSPFERKQFLSLCCIVTNTEWNGIIKLIIEVKCIRIILSPNLIDLVVF